jgi:inner membrane protein
MASCFGHAVAAGALGTVMLRKGDGVAPWIAGVLLANMADLDVLGLQMGIPYAHAWGHRGATHSAALALLMGWAALAVLRPAPESRRRVGAFLVLSALSHGLLDMATSGGLGVALAWPIHEARYFWPRRPIRVSPIGIGPFFSNRGLRVLASEAVWIGLPSIGACLLGWVLGSRRATSGPAG